MEKLLYIQKDINENGPDEFKNLELIRIEELRAIRRIWVNEYHEFDDSLPKIYEKVFGVEFRDPQWLHYENFGKSEWNLLREVCSELYPEEQLLFESVYSLIDIENKASGLNQRKGILDAVNDTISKTYYRDEEDALSFYANTMIRKKENGGKYNEKFLDFESLDELNDEEEQV